MKPTKCYSVRLASLTSISEKAYKAVGFDGSECILPKSQVFGTDYEVQKSDAYWIAAWILEQKDIQYSSKKEGWYYPDSGNISRGIKVDVEHHIPEKLEKSIVEPDQSLLKWKRN